MHIYSNNGKINGVPVPKIQTNSVTQHILHCVLYTGETSHGTVAALGPAKRVKAPIDQSHADTSS